MGGAWSAEGHQTSPESGRLGLMPEDPASGARGSGGLGCLSREAFGATLHDSLASSPHLPGRNRITPFTGEQTADGETSLSPQLAGGEAGPGPSTGFQGPRQSPLPCL